MIGTCIIPIGLAKNAFRDLADRAAAATLRASKAVAYLADTGALWTSNFPASRASHESRFIDTVCREACDFFQPLSYPDSFLGQGACLRRCVRYVLANSPETAVPFTDFASLHSIFGATNAEKILGVPNTVVVWMLVIGVR